MDLAVDGPCEIASTEIYDRVDHNKKEIDSQDNTYKFLFRPPPMILFLILHCFRLFVTHETLKRQ